MISEQDKAICGKVIQMALGKGASKARVTLDVSLSESVGTLNGEIDKISRSLDRSVSIALFADGKFGTFSTNRLDERDLSDFIDKALDTVRILQEDECRNLPDPSRCCRDALTGNELGLYDAECLKASADERRKAALSASVFKATAIEGAEIASEEAEYCESEQDEIICDSNGLFCRHSETSFEYWVEINLKGRDGRIYSGWSWTSSPDKEGFRPENCGKEAIDKALAQMNPQPLDGGRYNMVVSREVASKLVNPLLTALSGYELQQNKSFLQDSLSKKIFSEGLTILDLCHTPGQSGSRLFDSEGVATVQDGIIENGTVKKYFLNTYNAAKMNMQPTIEDSTRAALQAWPRKGLDCKAIMEMCGEGILVTEFNGGNCNGATGDFSYGIQGIYFKNGKTVHPVSGMVVTGNMKELWNNLLAAGDDCRACMSKLIPTLAFANTQII